MCGSAIVKDWKEYIRQCVKSDLWGFVVLDYYRTEMADAHRDHPSHFIDNVLCDLPKEGIDPVAFHNVLLCVCVHLLGNDFSDIMEKSLNFLKGLESSLTEEQLEAVLQQYRHYGKEEVFLEKLESSKLVVAKADARSEKTRGAAKKGARSKRIAGPIDVAVVIALKEEFRDFHAEIKETCNPHRDPRTGDYWYPFERKTADQSLCRGVAAFTGEAGEKKAGLLAERINTELQPLTVVVLGIAAGINEDIRVGDVVAATLVDSYIECSKATEQKKGDPFELEPSGDPYRPSPDLVKSLRNLEFANDDDFRRWQEHSSKQLQKLIPEEQLGPLIQTGIVRKNPRLVEGHVASGPTVGAAKSFLKWLKGRDRNYLALEMESGGVLAAIQDVIDPKRSLVLRGVSDYGDQRKKQLDRFKDGVFRRYAMCNAIQLLWTLIDLGALPRIKDR